MLAKSKHRSAALYFAACTASCSLLAPQDSELMTDDRLLDAALPRTDAGDARGDPAQSRDAGPAQDASPEPGPDAASNACAAVLCPVNTVCRERQGTATCDCRPGFLPSAGSCRRATSCDELHSAQPDLPSGGYSLLPLGSTVEVYTYCEMEAEGGGWTLILNQGPSFDPRGEVQALIIQTDAGRPDAGRTDAGRTDAGPTDAGRSDAGPADTCFDHECVSGAYSTVPVRSDVMLDMSDEPISGELYSARAIFTAIGVAGRAKTLRELFTTGPYFLDTEDNSNVTVRVRSGTTCASSLAWEMGNILCNPCRAEGDCGATVLVFGDSDSICSTAEPVHFAIGAAYSHTEPWGQCAGWPQDPNYGDYNFLPDNYRIWLR
jgi:hypothetical protein